MSRASVAFVLMLATVALGGVINMSLAEHRPPNAGLPLVRDAYGTPYDDSRPPSRYWADASAYVSFVSPSRIDAMCGEKHDPKHPLEACQQGNRIILPNPNSVPAELFARLAAHELGHQNGWPGNHPR